jgi:coproporphyrinogen III oxidase-like Fe-S oxidoreductase
MISSLLASHVRHASAACMRFDHSLEQVEPPQPQTERTYLLYVHIPFCESICPFCPFHRVLMKEDRAQHYFVALREEIRGIVSGVSTSPLSTWEVELRQLCRRSFVRRSR